MGATYTVTDATQPIYPDGLQSAFIINNNGPYSIYVDSVSSIGPSSILIPPTGWLAWDANQPLWVKRVSLPAVGTAFTPTAPAPCVINITPNHNAVQFTNSIDKVLGSWVDNKGTGTVASPLLECTAFNTLIINLASPSMVYNVLGEAYSNLKTWNLQVRWYDALGDVITVDTYLIHGYFNDGATQSDVNAYTLGPKAILPVKGTYCIIAITPINGFPQSMSLLVSATTRVLPKRIYSGWMPTYCIPTVFGGVTPQISWEDAMLFNFDNRAGGNTYMIPSLTTTLQWAYTTSGGGTAGSILLTYSDGVTRVAPDSAIPIATASGGIIRVPQDQALLMTVNPVLNAGVNNAISRLMITWL
jgi:hypothetical protein